MVKFNLALLLLCACSLWTPAFGEDIEDIEDVEDIDECRNIKRIIRNQYANHDGDTFPTVQSCERGDDDKTMISLTLKNSGIEQKTIDELAKYTSLKELNFVRVHNFEENISFESLNIDSISFNNLKYGRKINKFSNVYIQTGILKTLKNVKEVHIRATKISQTTLNELSTLTKLKKLELSESGYDENLDFSVLNNSKKLTDLKLSTHHDGNPINDSIKTLCQIKTLKNLNLDSLGIATIPKCIGNLKNLESLNLNYNDLTNLPSEMGKLKKLKELYLDENQLSSIPSFLAKLSNLEILFLSHNEITKIPDSLGNLKNLEALNLYSNYLKDLSSEMGKLTKLKELYLDENQLSSIPSFLAKLSNLEILSLSHNKITKIPDSLGKLKNLEALYLNNNKINGTLPKSLNNLKNLEIIDLQSNVNIKGKTLTNPKLKTCQYTLSNEIVGEFCLNENSKCIPVNENLPKC